MSAAKAQIAIIGAGIQGCAAARELALRGVDVLVLDASHAGRHASGVNSGGVRTLGRHLAELPLALASKQLWSRIADLVDDDCGFRPVGQLRIATADEHFEDMRRRSGLIEDSGLEHAEQLVSEAQVRALVPAFAGPVAGGCFVKGDGYAQPFRTTQAFRRKAAALGARFVEHKRVLHAQRVGDAWRLHTGDGFEVLAQQVINCAGGWAREVSELFGDSLPVVANGSMQIVTTRVPPLLPCVLGVSGASLSIKQFDNGTVVIGGGRRGPVDLGAARADLTLPGLVHAARAAARHFPALAQATIARCWSGIEGFTPDGLPVIGPGRAPGVLHAAGFSAHGFQLGPAVGMVLADLATGALPAVPLDGLQSARFTQPATQPAAERRVYSIA